MNLFGKLDRLIQRWVNFVRIYKLKLLGAEIGDNVKVYGRVTVLGDPKNLRIGSGSSLNEGVLIELRDQVVIGKNVHISPGVRLLTGYLDLETFSSNQEWRHKSCPIFIEENVWLASGVTVCAGVTIGGNAVIGAGALVLESIQKNSFAGGLPAKVIRRLD